jgi:hypothetical protein
MVDRQNDGGHAVLAQSFQADKLLIQEYQLGVVQPAEGFAAITVKADDRHQRSVEREIHAGLGHGAAQNAA